MKEGAKPIATSSNERDFFFGVVPKLNLQVAKPVVQEIVSWIMTNIPSHYKKAGPENSAEKRKHGDWKDEKTPAAKLPKRSSVEFANYSIQRFEQDAASLTPFPFWFHVAFCKRGK